MVVFGRASDIRLSQLAIPVADCAPPAAGSVLAVAATVAAAASAAAAAVALMNVSKRLMVSYPR